MAEQSEVIERALPRLAAAALLCLGGLALGGWGLSLAAGGAKVSAAAAGFLAVGAGAAVLLGVLLLLRVLDAALVATVFLDAGVLAAVLVPLGAARVRLSLPVPLCVFVAVLVGVALIAGKRGQGRPWLAVALQLFYAAALAIYATRVGPGALGATGWIALLGSGLGAALTHFVYVATRDRQPWERLAGLPPWARALIVLGVSFGAFAAAAGPRLRHPTPNNHFVYLADCYLHGRLSLSKEQLQRKHKLKQFDDWARVEKVKLRRDVKTRHGVLKQGSELRGIWLMRQRRRTDRFRTTRGDVVQLPAGTWSGAGNDWYISFPPLPAVLMAPGVALWGYRFNDVWFSVALASLSPLLFLLLLGRLRREGLSDRTDADDYWLTLLFAVGTVNYFVSVRGEVWYTAHVLGVLLLLLYLHASLGARRPLLAGLALGAAVASRVTLAFAVPIFLAELVRSRGGWGTEGGLLRRLKAVQWQRLKGPAVWFALPLTVIAALLLWHNQARFDSPFEFGHRYLDIYWKDRIQQFGLFDVHYLARNLSAAFTLTPHFQPESPYVLVSRHGMSMLLVTPALLLLVWPRIKGPWHRPLWLSVALMAGLVLCYQNSGFVQFSYRFALDFMPLLVLLIALGGRRLSTPVKVLILIGVLLNLFGAITFGTAPEFYGRTNWVWTPLDPGCAC
ncbi:MAG: hypothetical protein ABI333_25175 [bacterium]